MPLNDQDVRALTYLAKRVRDDTYGAGRWDEAGIAAKVTELKGQELVQAVERVIRHAADKDAKTPGAILRPFVPPAAAPSREPDAPLHEVCSTCHKPEADCRRIWADDHEYARNVKPEAAPADVSERVQALKQHIACEDPRPAPPAREHKPSEHATATRAALTTEETA